METEVKTDIDQHHDHHDSHDHPKNRRPKMDDKKKMYIAVGILVLAVVLAGAYKKYGLNIFPKDLGPDAAKARVIEFVNNNLVQPGTKTEATSVTEEGDLYKVSIKVGTQDIDTYITKDGQKFFPNAIDIDKEKQKAEEAKNATAEAEKAIPKTDKPVVDLYVMSFCPFGNKAEDTLKPAYELLKNKVDFRFHYIVSSSGDAIQSLHGEPEVLQNKREACVLKNNGKDAWMNFVTYVNAKCGSDGSCWEAGAKSLKLDPAKITSCVTAQGVTLMKDNEKAATAANASGSPTMTINGQTTQAVYQYGNPDSYKEKICSAFNTTPAECGKKLEAQAAAATAPAAGGSCN